MRSQFDRARPRLTTGEEEPVRSNDVSCLVAASLDRVNIFKVFCGYHPIPSLAARQIYSFLVAGECLCGDDDKKGNLHIVHALC